MNRPTRLNAYQVLEAVQSFEAQFGRVSFVLAAHAAVAHRLRPDLVALIRTNFLESPERSQAFHDADVLFGPLCIAQGGGFYEMQRDIKDFLVEVLDRITPPGQGGRRRSQDVARLLRHHFRQVEAEPRYATHRYSQFRQENLWRALAVDDPIQARRHVQDHARRRNSTSRETMRDAPRGGGIISVAGSMLEMFHDDMLYLEVQDLIADGQVEDGVALLEILVESGADHISAPDLDPSALLREERAFLERRRNTALGKNGGAGGNALEQCPQNAGDGFGSDLEIDRRKLKLRDTALTRAVFEGDEKRFEEALSTPGIDLDQLDRYGHAALHHAVFFGREEMATRLIEAGACIDVLSARLATPLFFAGEYGLTEVARLLLERGAKLRHFTEKKNSPLMEAAYFGRRDIVALYLEQLRGDKAHLNARNDDGSSALSAAMMLGDTVIYDMLIDAGADPVKPMSEGYTHLHAAASGQSAALVDEVLQTGYQVDPLTSTGWSPLHIACSNTPSPEVVDLLLDCGADPFRATIHGWTPSRLAASWGNLEIFERILALGDTLAPQHYYDAAYNGGVRVLKHLLDQPRPLVEAKLLADPLIRSGKPEVVEFLISDETRFGITRDRLFLKAVEYGKDEIITLYREKGWGLPADPVPEEPKRSAAPGQPKPAPPLETAIRKADANWRKTMTALLDWPEAFDRVADLIFIQSVEKGKASVLRLYQDNGWPMPTPPEDSSNKSKATGMGRWLPVLNKAQSGWRDTMEVLLGWPEARAVLGDELFEAAISKGHVDVFDIFDEQGWDRPKHPSKAHGWGWVVGKDVPGRDSIIAELVQRPDAVLISKAGHTMMHLAAEGGLMETLEVLAKLGQPMDEKDPSSRTPLSAASASNQVAAMRLLLQAGADPNARVDVEQVPVFFKARIDHLPMLREFGADLTRTALNGRTWLHHIVRDLTPNNADQILKLPVDAGIPVDAADVAGNTPLHLIAEAGKTDAIGPLLKAGAQIEARNKAGYTPLLLAMARDREDAVTALRAAGANVTARTPGGLSLWHFAALMDREEIFEDKGLAFDEAKAIAWEPSRTVLQMAAEAGSARVVKSLLGRKVNPDRAAGSTPPPAMLALIGGHYSVVLDLVKAGANQMGVDPRSGMTLFSTIMHHRSGYLARKKEMPTALEQLHDLLVRKRRKGGDATSKAPARTTGPMPSGVGPAETGQPSAQTPRSRTTPPARLQPVQPAPPRVPSDGQRSRTVYPVPTRAVNATWELTDTADPTAAGWDLVTGGRLGKIARAVTQTGASYASQPITEYVSRPLSFYDGIELVRARSNAWGGSPIGRYFVDLPGELMPLDGTQNQLSRINANAPIRLSPDNVFEYLRFFTFFLRTNKQPFYIIEGPGDPNFAAIKHSQSQLLAEAAVPLILKQVKAEEEAAFQVTATVYFDDLLLKAWFQVKMNGSVDMVNDEKLAGPLKPTLSWPIT